MSPIARSRMHCSAINLFLQAIANFNNNFVIRLHLETSRVIEASARRSKDTWKKNMRANVEAQQEFKQHKMKEEEINATQTNCNMRDGSSQLFFFRFAKRTRNSRQRRHRMFAVLLVSWMELIHYKTINIIGENHQLNSFGWCSQSSALKNIKRSPSYILICWLTRDAAFFLWIKKWKF